MADRLTVFSLSTRGVYPSETLIMQNRAYFVCKGIPFIAALDAPQVDEPFPEDESELTVEIPYTGILYAAILLACRKMLCLDAPTSSRHICFVLDPERHADFEDVIGFVDRVLSGTETITVRRPPFNQPCEPESVTIWGQSVEDVVRSSANRFQFTGWKLSIPAVTYFYNRIIREQSYSDNYLLIAVHHLVQAARLGHHGFIEESGLNMYLSFEAIVWDHMVSTGTENKKAAAETLLSEVRLPHGCAQLLSELREYRNLALAHIDHCRFTEWEHVNDPDAYCFETFEPMCIFLSNYLSYKRHLRQARRRLFRLRRKS